MPWLDVMEMAGVVVAGLTGTVALGVTLTAWLGWAKLPLNKSPVVAPEHARALPPAGDERPTLPRGVARPAYLAPRQPEGPTGEEIRGLDPEVIGACRRLAARLAAAEDARHAERE